MTLRWAAPLIVVGVSLGSAAWAAPPVVVELFTSEGCSSCPPADALLAELAASRPDILVLDQHVTYWDRLGWKDPFSLSAVTDRQKRYAQTFGADNVYTPQLVAGGRYQAVGSDRSAVLAALAAAKAAATGSVALRLDRDAEGLTVFAGAGSGRGTLWLVGFDPHHTTHVGAGENGGRTLTEVNVVRSLDAIGDWRGAPMSLRVPDIAGQRAAVLLQAADGEVLAVASFPPG